MLAKKNRLLPSVKIPKKNQINTPYFSLRYNFENNRACRFGFIITKRVDKRAVVRNKIKRRFRSCLEENIKNIKEGYDLLFFIKKESLGLDRDKLCDQILKTLKIETLIS